MVLKKWLPFMGIVVFILLLDQVSKEWVINNLLMGQTITPIPALSPYLQVTRSSNTGAAFGLFSDFPEFFLIASILITIVIIVLYYRSARDAYLQHIAFALVVGGALGNVFDRLQHGAVVDFVHIRIPGVLSNVSNFADHAIVLGVFLLFIESIISERRQRRITRTETDSLSIAQPAQDEQNQETNQTLPD